MISWISTTEKQGYTPSLAHLFMGLWEERPIYSPRTNSLKLISIFTSVMYGRRPFSVSFWHRTSICWIALTTKLMQISSKNWNFIKSDTVTKEVRGVSFTRAVTIGDELEQNNIPGDTRHNRRPQGFFGIRKSLKYTPIQGPCDELSWLM